jgi:SpoVK/Ycf46/Vps4 family AAA+-type ATPase
MTQIDNLLSEDQYIQVLSKFEANCMKPALTVLLYGKPGTGKTEFVKQIARRHQRAILQVDISGIKDMWVGESEKNLKRVFFEYAQALKKFPIVPILLFNEADALLGKRTKVSDSVDQMLNSMQNILLQELEEFKGIFIATTNLIHNMDAAFDRRILYKTMIDLPDTHSRYKILQNNFPEFDDEVLSVLAHKYHLSGAQIQNIKKRYLAEAILFNVPKSEIEKYAEEETQFRQTNTKFIGYINY